MNARATDDPGFAEGTPSAPSGTIYLTFDDGPDPQWTPRILDVLASADARATFFVIGAASQALFVVAERFAGRGMKAVV